MTMFHGLNIKSLACILCMGFAISLPACNSPVNNEAQRVESHEDLFSDTHNPDGKPDYYLEKKVREAAIERSALFLFAIRCTDPSRRPSASSG